VRYALDSSILGVVCHPKPSQAIARRFQVLITDPNTELYIPEIADYELRRKLLHLIRQGRASGTSLRRLDALNHQFIYLPVTTAVMRRAAEFWAQARSIGRTTAAEEALDGDVIIAAQAESVGATIITRNTKHFELFGPVETWLIDHSESRG
jgi:predicted nucleic acid-binding protein